MSREEMINYIDLALEVASDREVEDVFYLVQENIG